MSDKPHTGGMGKRLYEKYAGTVHQVYYDHGTSPKKEPNYCRPTPFFGDKASAASTLSAVDLLVVNAESSRVELIAEIEENAHEPKKIIGDIVNLMLADQVRVKGKDYPFGNRVLVLGIQANPRGQTRAKVLRLCFNLAEMNERAGKPRIDIVPVFHPEAVQLVGLVQAEIERWLEAPCITQ